MLIIGSLLQAGVQRAHVLYLAWVLLGILILHSGWGAINHLVIVSPQR